MNAMQKSTWWLLAVVLTALVLWLCFATIRIRVVQVQALYGGAFLAFIGMSWITLKKKCSVPLLWILAVGILVRMALVFATPSLSDDYYRFTWDGYMVTQGINPFGEKPSVYVEQHPEDTTAAELFAAHSKNFPGGMNSKNFYSIYPTVNQAIFAVAYVLGSPNYGNLVVMKVILLLFECLSFWLLVKLLRQDRKDPNNAILYWLNPLVMIEFVGNIHFEGIALAFLLLAFWFLKNEKLTQSGAALALAIGTKLNPLLLACVHWKALNGKRLLHWWLVIFLSTVLVLGIFLNPENIVNFLQSLRLYFFVFQFNGGVLTTGSLVFQWLTEADGIAILMRILPWLTIVGILALNFLKDRWSTSERILLAYALYYLFATTVHPWYVIMLLPFAILSGWRFPIVWTYVIFWTYLSYQQDGFQRNESIIVLEYVLIGLVCWWDIRIKRRQLSPVE